MTPFSFDGIRQMKRKSFLNWRVSSSPRRHLTVQIRRFGTRATRRTMPAVPRAAVALLCAIAVEAAPTASYQRPLSQNAITEADVLPLLPAFDEKEATKLLAAASARGPSEVVDRKLASGGAPEAPLFWKPNITAVHPSAAPTPVPDAPRQGTLAVLLPKRRRGVARLRGKHTALRLRPSSAPTVAFDAGSGEAGSGDSYFGGEAGAQAINQAINNTEAVVATVGAPGGAGPFGKGTLPPYGYQYYYGGP